MQLSMDEDRDRERRCCSGERGRATCGKPCAEHSQAKFFIGNFVFHLVNVADCGILHRLRRFRKTPKYTNDYLQLLRLPV